ncbi:hypothetical protein AC579_1664, partial [Pseudocercospora musae]
AGGRPVSADWPMLELPSHLLSASEEREVHLPPLKHSAIVFPFNAVFIDAQTACFAFSLLHGASRVNWKLEICITSASCSTSFRPSYPPQKGAWELQRSIGAARKSCAACGLRDFGGAWADADSHIQIPATRRLHRAHPIAT